MLGLFQTPAFLLAQIFTNGASLANTQIGYGDANGRIQGAAGLAIVGTPSATAPSTGTNGPGLVNGIVNAGSSGAPPFFTSVSFGNGGAQTTGLMGYTCQGTPSAPGATISGDSVGLLLRGFDGVNYTATQGQVKVKALSTWTAGNRECGIEFAVTPNSSTTLTVAGNVNGNQILSWGGGTSTGISTFSGGAVGPKLQTVGGSVANASIGMSSWNNGTNAPVLYIAKSRSTTIGTAGVITTGDALGTISFQGDDGTNMVEGAAIAVTSTGTIGTNQIPGSMALKVANSSGTNAARITLTSASATVASGTTLIVSDTTASTSGSTGCITASGGIGAAGAVWSGIAPAAATTPAFGAAGTSAVAGGVTDSYTSAIRLTPGFSGAQTVTRHNYLDLNNPSLSSTTLTDAAVMRFDANAGTHKAVDSGTTKTTPGTVSAWVKVNINGTINYIPCYTSKTA